MGAIHTHAHTHMIHQKENAREGIWRDYISHLPYQHPYRSLKFHRLFLSSFHCVFLFGFLIPSCSTFPQSGHLFSHLFHSFNFYLFDDGFSSPLILTMNNSFPQQIYISFSIYLANILKQKSQNIFQRFFSYHCNLPLPSLYQKCALRQLN